MTLTPVSVFASWVRIDPTPPAPPRTSSVPVSSAVSRSLSNSASHAVIVVRGRAAASAWLSDFGLSPTMRSSTSWYFAYVPERSRLPA